MEQDKSIALRDVTLNHAPTKGRFYVGSGITGIAKKKKKKERKEDKDRYKESRTATLLAVLSISVEISDCLGSVQLTSPITSIR